MFSVENLRVVYEKICQETGMKIRERISVQKSSKIVLATFKGHQTVLNCRRLGKGLGTQKHLFVSVKINYIFGYSDF